MVAQPGGYAACRPLSVPLALQAASDGVRAHLHALLATKDVPVVMEPHERRRSRVKLDSKHMQT